MNTTTMSPFSWMNHLVHMQGEWESFLRKMSQAPKVAEIARGVRVGTTPSEVVYKLDKLRLLNYTTGAKPQFHTPTLVVFALINRPYILDLKPGKSVVEHFVNQGFETYNLDWGVPTYDDRHLGMEDYIERYFDQVVDKVRERSGCDKINILGYCMGGSMSAMYTALHPDKVKNLMMLAAPVDWSSDDHLLAKWLDKKYFDVDKLIDVHGNAPADLLQGSFEMLKPVANYVEKYLNFYEKMEDQQFLEDFFAMEAWLNDNIPVAGEMFRQFVTYCMQENRLMKGELRIGDRLVDLKQITCPILNITAEKDHLVPSALSQPLNDVVSSTDCKWLNFPAGHIGLAVGSRAHRELWPEAATWFADRSDTIQS